MPTRMREIASEMPAGEVTARFNAQERAAAAAPLAQRLRDARRAACQGNLNGACTTCPDGTCPKRSPEG